MGDRMSNIERKVMEILKILSEHKKPVGARLIANQLRERGINLTEQAVRYHLRILDERGLTKNCGLKGRVITEEGLKEIEKGNIADRIGYGLGRIHECIFYSDFNPEKGRGRVIANLAIFPRESLRRVADVFKKCGSKGLAFSTKVVLVENLPFLDVEELGMYYISSFTLDAILCRNGIYSTLRFAGSVEISDFELKRFTQVIGFEESSITALDLFIQRMFSEKSEELILEGEGEVFGIYREIPFVARESLIEIMERLKEYDIKPLYAVGEPNEQVCGVPPKGINKVGFVCVGPSTPIGILRASGIPIRVHISHEILDYSEFSDINELEV
jgi:hypothetical protein